MGSTELVVGHAADPSEFSEVDASDLDVRDPQAGVGAVVVRRDQRGMVSAEWAVGIIAAIGIAGVLIAVVTNGAVQDALLGFVLKIINSFSGMLVKG